ncbi:MAG: septal ring lytic transglycosylase RlpA family protein [Epsilonproteobacteria bacterium]|nr:septal ring lytic transglycosylase RlpA family protein [Campylobacterota bacterium]
MKTKNSITVGLSLVTLFMLSGCVAKTTGLSSSSTLQDSYKKTTASKEFQKVTYGQASYYSRDFNGKKTASGEIYNMYAKTAAHKTLPFNTMVRVTDLVTNKSDIVRINDRGPYAKGRVIDLSYASAKKLGLVNRGVTDVKIEIVGYNGKVDKRLSLPVSTQACVGDHCKASIAKSTAKSDTSIKPFALASKKETKYQPVIESVYDEDTLPIMAETNYASNSSVSNSYNRPHRVINYSDIDKYSKKISIQVGAFRRYTGAKIYARRYGLLDREYKAVIKKDMEDGKPLYRVRIEGFKNDREARTFMSRYSLNGAFLVRK